MSDVFVVNVMPASSPLLPRVIVAGVSTIISGIVGYGVWVMFVAAEPRASVEVRPGAEATSQPQALFVGDAAIGSRPRRCIVVRSKIGPLFGEDIVATRHQNNLSLIREDDLPAQLGGPRVLLHGDSHMMGVVSTADNAASLLEGMLRDRPGLDEALVLNAACYGYTLYQYVLRHRTLRARLQPDLIVVVVFLGNDFLGLENTRIPHLDDELQERPPSDRPPPETTTKRMAALGLEHTVQLHGLFWQGLDQACYFHQNPGRLSPVKKKAVKVLELLKAEAVRDRVELMLVLLPSFDLVFPAFTKILETPLVREVVDSGVQAALHGWFKTAVAEAGIESIDLLPRMLEDGRKEQFANDLHLWIPGHRLVAEVLRDRVVEKLKARK